MEDYLKKLSANYSQAKYKYKQSKVENLMIEIIENRVQSSTSKFELKNIPFKQLYEKGLKTPQGILKGEQAIEYRIQSLRLASNKRLQKQNYINNYLNVMENAGYSQEEIAEIKKKLQSLSPTELSYAIKKGIFQIAVLYSSSVENYSRVTSYRIDLVKKKYSKIKEKANNPLIKDLAKRLVKYI